MKKNKSTISANEINRFVYCNYQWYYGKIYGSARLRELVNERNKKLDLKDMKSLISLNLRNMNRIIIKFIGKIKLMTLLV